jgi:YHS domain-containing protein
MTKTPNASIAIGLLTVLALALAAAYAGSEKGNENKGEKNVELKTEPPLCPVMDEPVDFSIKLQTDQGPVYFCCKKCVRVFESKPERFAEKVKAHRQALAKMPKVQVACPLTGDPIDKKAFVEVGGQKVWTCCMKCANRYKESPEKFAKGLADSYTYQTICPVMGEKIDPSVFVDAGGKSVYFCCTRCTGTFFKDPAKFVPKLEAQGTYIDADKVKLAADKDAPAGQDHAGAGHEGHDH